jgi:hypothetical protein
MLRLDCTLELTTKPRRRSTFYIDVPPSQTASADFNAQAVALPTGTGRDERVGLTLSLAEREQQFSQIDDRGGAPEGAQLLVASHSRRQLRRWLQMSIPPKHFTTDRRVPWPASM